MTIVNNESRDRVTTNGKSIPGDFSRSTSENSNKRKPRVILECRREKRQRLNQSFKQQCRSILRSLMEHPHGFAFDQPVDDPVKLKIPDYFSIITEPMDLGTIKLKLEDNMYFDAGEFVSDISLTFSNAMLYNPPGKHVNKFAKELIDVFNQRWKLLETKLKCMGRNLEQLSNLDKIEKKRQDKKPNIKKRGQNAKLSYLNRAVNGRLLEEKHDLWKELVKISKKARTAAKFRAAETGLRMKAEAEAEAESKMQREREGEAARIAVEKIGETVGIDENQEIMEELEAIMGAISRGNLRNPLEQLGLYIKDDYMEDDEEAILQGEEGEILSWRPYLPLYSFPSMP